MSERIVDVLEGKQDDSLVILLCGGDKRTQASDIENAQTRWQDFLQRST